MGELEGFLAHPHHEEALAHLRHPIIGCVEDARADVVPEFRRRSKDQFERGAVDLVRKAGDVLQQKRPGAHRSQDSKIGSDRLLPDGVIERPWLVLPVEARL